MGLRVLRVSVLNSVFSTGLYWRLAPTRMGWWRCPIPDRELSSDSARARQCTIGPSSKDYSADQLDVGLSDEATSVGGSHQFNRWRRDSGGKHTLPSRKRHDGAGLPLPIPANDSDS